MINWQFFCFILQAPEPVKTYAKNLIDGILNDTITKALSDAENDDKNNEETDISLSLATEETKEDEDNTMATVNPVNPVSTSNNVAVKSPSSHVETDSLDESEHAGQHS